MKWIVVLTIDLFCWTLPTCSRTKWVVVYNSGKRFVVEELGVPNSPLLAQQTHSSLPNEKNKQNNLGEMATIPTNQNSRLPPGTISPTHSGELPTEDEVDSPTPSSTASEPITDQFLPSPKTNQRSTNRINDTLHMKSPRLKNLATEDVRTTDEEDLEGVTDDAFTWPTHSSYDEQR